MNTTESRRNNATTRCLELFDQGLCCAESVVAAFAEYANGDVALLMRASSGFCAGQGRTSGTCGALTGGIMALGIAHGRDLAGCHGQVQKLIRQFQEAFGDTDCSRCLAVI
ncbi:MAG: C-GCAxxG-C-C family protein [Proteobacteria bacterium]|nr:C-GCAxxG-C-C family protein [Pseudomonadota bacterium]MBU1612721.1 C-GCAxxG-C-C family protein [Pseudomonadota bacterium]